MSFSAHATVMDLRKVLMILRYMLKRTIGEILQILVKNV